MKLYKLRITSIHYLTEEELSKKDLNSPVEFSMQDLIKDELVVIRDSSGDVKNIIELDATEI